MQRRRFLKLGAMTAMTSAVAEGVAVAARADERANEMAEPVAAAQAAAANAADAADATARPNIIFIVCDQRCYGLSKETGAPWDTSPTLDRLQRAGVGFEHNYCTMPVCVPSRTSMLTGRWPEAHRVRMNLQAKAAFFDKDLYQVAKAQGYRTALVGKNHTYLAKESVDVFREYFHDGGPPDPGESQAQGFDRYLRGLNFNVAEAPAPFPVTAQLPHRIVTDAMQFITSSGDQPFLMQVSIPEPHDPEQVPAPYWNMFPPESLPERCADASALAHMGYRAQWEYRLQQDNFPDTDKMWRRYRSNYLGALRMIDDQIKRMVEHLETRGLTERTLIVFTADHGDFFLDYGLGHKGVSTYETLTHTPFIWSGYGVKPTAAALEAFTSMADMMPTLCEVMGAEIPHGVQGRSLWPVLRGEAFPREEFRSIYAGVGVGGLYYEEAGRVPTLIAHDQDRPGMFDELNKVTQSGNQKMVRMGDFKLVFDMMGYGQFYNLRLDPCELQNLFNQPHVAKEQAALMAELAMWTIRTQDSLPTGPQSDKYRTKWSTEHNWYAPYRQGGPAPNAFVP